MPPSLPNQLPFVIEYTEIIAPVENTVQFSAGQGHNLGTAPTSGSWAIVIEYVYRYGLRLAHINVSFNTSGVSSISLNNYLGTTAVGNTKVCFDIIDGTVFLVIHRVGQNNVFSRVRVLFVQKGTSSSALPFRLETGELYTPGTTLMEADLV